MKLSTIAKSAVFLAGMFSVSVPLTAQTANPPDMIEVKGGTFRMGSPDGYVDETPVHQVTLSDFSIGKYEVTVAQYRQFCNETGRKMPADPDEDWYVEHDNAVRWQWNDNHPIVNVTYFDARAYCQWLTEKFGGGNSVYRLPTEAQWEYAARGGQKSENFKYAGSDDVDEVAWYDETTNEKGIHPVGKLLPNELGIYDMSGNAWEWCLDYYGKYSKSSVKDPEGPGAGMYRVIRGGSWYYVEDMARITSRDGPEPAYTNYNYGFRVVKVPSKKK